MSHFFSLCLFQPPNTMWVMYEVIGGEYAPYVILEVVVIGILGYDYYNTRWTSTLVSAVVAARRWLGSFEL